MTLQEALNKFTPYNLTYRHEPREITIGSRGFSTKAVVSSRNELEIKYKYKTSDEFQLQDVYSELTKTLVLGTKEQFSLRYLDSTYNCYGCFIRDVNWFPDPYDNCETMIVNISCDHVQIDAILGRSFEEYYDEYEN